MLRQSLNREFITAVTVTGESAMLKFKDTTGTRFEAAHAVRAFLSAYERVLDEANAFDDFESATAWFSAGDP